MFTYVRRALLPMLFLAATACGSSIDPTADATSVADVPPSARIELKAKNTRFEQSVVATANAEITVVLDNQDNRTLHNFSLYSDENTRELIHLGELFPGVETREATFTAPPPGIYFFRCDVHPDSMTGTLVAK